MTNRWENRQTHRQKTRHELQRQTSEVNRHMQRWMDPNDQLAQVKVIIDRICPF